MKLVIVESPAKATTIEKYLGSGYKVVASYGHIRDLPPKNGSVDPDKDFAMLWERYGNKSGKLKEIEKIASKAESLILATDPDREGEAISWHIEQHLKKKHLLPKDVKRVTFNSITKDVVTKAMTEPRQLDMDLVDAYLARRALDYLVGFTLSPILWRKLPSAKSAGRVQSVALRLVVNREQEIESFIPDEYWAIEADLEYSNILFTSRLIRWDGNKLDKLSIKTEEEATKAKSDVENSEFTVSSVITKPAFRNPQPPFTTSTLQQEAARKLGFAASHTMRLAQSLYEEGLITYMRTDGVQMDQAALMAARDAASEKFGSNFIPDKPRYYHVKAKNAQEAHEPIRPTNFNRETAGGGDHARLYSLIWKRALASQMVSARLEKTTVDLVDKNNKHTLRVNGQVILFPGFLALYEESTDNKDDSDSNAKLPNLKVGDIPNKKDVRALQKFTMPPPKFTEASLVKRMEELGIGRPSTYAATLQVLKDRGYVTVEGHKFSPSDPGRILVAFLERFFSRYVSYDFTASLEDSLDDVSGGRENWKKLLRAFWLDFKPKTEEIAEQKPSDVTTELTKSLDSWLFPPRKDGVDPHICPECHKGSLILRGGSSGAFLSCSNYPECKYARGIGMDISELNPNGGNVLGYKGEASLENEVTKLNGKYGPYVQLGEGKTAKRSSIPKDVDPSSVDLQLALQLLELPKVLGVYPETGKEIIASIGKFGPYLNCDGSYVNIKSTKEFLETTLEQAIDLISKAPKRDNKSKILSKPTAKKQIKLARGKFGYYVSDGKVNAPLPKGTDPETVTLEDALKILKDRASFNKRR